MFIIGIDFKSFVVEVFDRFIIEQTIHGSAIGQGVKAIHLMTKLHAPARELQGKRDIDKDRDGDDQCVVPAITTEQNTCNQQELGDGWHNIEDQQIDD